MLKDEQLKKFKSLFDNKIKPAILENKEGFDEFAKKAEIYLKSKGDKKN